MDKLLVAGAMAYIALPIDLIPDFIPFLGEVDDVFLLVIALQRLVANAGRPVLLSHWTGAIEDLAELNLKEALAAAAFFLPRGHPPEAEDDRARLSEVVANRFATLDFDSTRRLRFAMATTIRSNTRPAISAFG